jgi:adenylate cyclase
MTQTHQLAAIMFTDIVGYTFQMGKDEEKAFELLRINRQIQKPLIESYNGRWLKEMGDGVLASFSSVLDAIQCAGAILKVVEDEADLKLRIGIHLGEVVFEDNDVFGDGVNVASRIEAEGEEDSITVSQAVYNEIKNKPGIQTKFICEKQLKNVKEPIKLYQLQVEVQEVKEPKPSEFLSEPQNIAQLAVDEHKAGGKKKVLIGGGIIILLLLSFAVYHYQVRESSTPTLTYAETDIDKSIGVLPCKSMSEDLEKQYLADGVMDVILLHLSKIEDLRVITRTSVEKYRDPTQTIPEIARELQVNYILEGSFQKYGDQARLIVQLSNAEEKEDHIWASEYNRDWSDIFSVQSEVAQTIASALHAAITTKEKETIEKIPTTNLIAYDFYLKGLEYNMRSFREEDFQYAVQMFKKAVEIDPNFTLGWLGLASASSKIFWFHYGRSEERIAQIKQYLDKAIALDPDLMEVQHATGMYYYQCELNYPKALQIFKKLASEYPNNYQVTSSIGWVYRRMGEFEIFLEQMDRLHSLNPSNWEALFATGETLFILGRYTEAEDYLKRAIDLSPSSSDNYIFLARAYLSTGEVDKARELLENNHHINEAGMYLARSLVELNDRNYQKAINILESSPYDDIVGHVAIIPKAMQLGLIYYAMGNREQANIRFNQAREVLEGKLNNIGDDPRLYSSLGLVYAGLSMTTEAKAAGNKALDIMDSSVDALRGLYREMDMVRILVMTGEYDEAIDKLEIQVQKNGNISVELLKIDPFWDPLRELDAFRTLIANPKYQINLND